MLAGDGPRASRMSLRASVGYPELVEDEKSGSLVPARDSAAFASAHRIPKRGGDAHHGALAHQRAEARSRAAAVAVRMYDVY
jgi:hypothetical protein